MRRKNHPKKITEIMLGDVRERVSLLVFKLPQNGQGLPLGMRSPVSIGRSTGRAFEALSDGCLGVS